MEVCYTNFATHFNRPSYRTKGRYLATSVFSLTRYTLSGWMGLCGNNGGIHFLQGASLHGAHSFILPKGGIADGQTKETEW